MSQRADKEQLYVKKGPQPTNVTARLFETQRDSGNVCILVVEKDPIKIHNLYGVAMVICTDRKGNLRCYLK